MFLCLFLLTYSIWYIHTWASPIPAADDTTIFEAGFDRPWPDWHWLWWLHNEHRLPVPKLLQFFTYRWTGDVRSGMYLQALMYAITALGCVWTSRRVRGHSRPWDCFFPLVWQQTGNAENLLMGFQIGIALPTACIVGALALIGFSSSRLRPGTAILSGAAILCLPLCGGIGVLSAPFLAISAVWIAWRALRQGDTADRVGARILLTLAISTALCCVAYVWGFRKPPGAEYSAGPLDLVRTTLGFMSLAFGPAYASWWPISGVVLACVIPAALYFAGRQIVSTRARDPRMSVTAAVLLAGLFLAVSTAYGRPAGERMIMANRYIPLPVPFFCALFFCSLMVAGERIRELVPMALCLAMLAATPASQRVGLEYGNERQLQSERVYAAVNSGHSAETMIMAYSNEFLAGTPDVAADLMRTWWRRGLPPFDRTVPPDHVNFEFPMLRARLTNLQAGVKPQTRWIDGRPVLLLAPESRLWFAPDEQANEIRGEFGVPDLLVEHGLTPGISLWIERQLEEGSVTRIFERRLDPLRETSQRGLLEFRVPFPPGGGGSLVLGTECPAQTADQRQYGWTMLRAVEIH